MAVSNIVAPWSPAKSLDHPNDFKWPSAIATMDGALFVPSNLSDLREIDQKLGHSLLHRGIFALSAQSLDFRGQHLFHPQRPPVQTIEDTRGNTDQ